MSAQLTTNDVNTLKDILENNEVGSIISYSGRFMYGKKCLGIETSNIAECMLQIGVSLALMGGSAHTTLEKLQGEQIKMDSLGMDSVIYFIDVTLPDDFVEEDEEDPYE